MQNDATELLGDRGRARPEPSDAAGARLSGRHEANGAGQPVPPASGRSFDRPRWLVAAATAAMVLFSLDAVLRIRGLAVFDYPVILTLNGLADRSRLFDLVQKAIYEYDLFQGVPLVALAAGAFAAADAPGRARIVIGGVGAAGAAIASRLIQLFLPSLPRPLYDPALPFHLPYGSDCEALRDWSSYPSDHAALFWGVAAATLLVNRRLGLAAIVLGLVSSLARLYFGLHYATDILGGALLGTAGVCAARAAGAWWEDRLLAFAAPRPALVGVVLFLFATQAALLFDDVRAVATSAAHQMKAMAHAGAPAAGRRGPGPAVPAPRKPASACGR